MMLNQTKTGLAHTSITLGDVLSDWRNALAFYGMSLVSVTLGSLLLHLTARFLSENQFAVLTDRIEAVTLRLAIIYNAFIFVGGTIFTVVRTALHSTTSPCDSTSWQW